MDAEKPNKPKSPDWPVIAAVLFWVTAALSLWQLPAAKTRLLAGCEAFLAVGCLAGATVLWSARHEKR